MHIATYLWMGMTLIRQNLLQKNGKACTGTQCGYGSWRPLIINLF